MISREKEHKLIAIYFYICELYNSTLKFECQRFSNNAKPDFTDQELMTIYLFVGYEQRYFQINEIHSFTKDYLFDWFPKLPSYQTFSYRLNLLTGAFQALANILISSFKPTSCSDLFSCAVSKVRQPIESFFNWLNEKTKIQRAMKVRSTAGLLIHLFGKLSIAFIYLIS